MLLKSTFDIETRLTRLTVMIELRIGLLIYESFSSSNFFMLDQILPLDFLRVILRENLRDINLCLFFLLFKIVTRILILLVIVYLLLLHLLSLCFWYRLLVYFLDRLLRSCTIGEHWLSSIWGKAFSLAWVKWRVELWFRLFLRIIFLICLWIDKPFLLHVGWKLVYLRW